MTLHVAWKIDHAPKHWGLPLTPCWGDTRCRLGSGRSARWSGYGCQMKSHPTWWHKEEEFILSAASKCTDDAKVLIPSKWPNHREQYPPQASGLYIVLCIWSSQKKLSIKLSNVREPTFCSLGERHKPNHQEQQRVLQLAQFYILMINEGRKDRLEDLKNKAMLWTWPWQFTGWGRSSCVEYMRWSPLNPMF